jgi:hypothetical protein
MAVMSLQLPLPGLTTLASPLQARIAGLLVASLPLPAAAAAAATVATALAPLSATSAQLTITVNLPLSLLSSPLRRRLQAAAAAGPSLTTSATTADALLTSALRNGNFATALAASGLAPSLGYASVDSLLLNVVPLPSRVQAPPSAVSGASSGAGISEVVSIAVGVISVLGCFGCVICCLRSGKKKVGSSSDNNSSDGSGEAEQPGAPPGKVNGGGEGGNPTPNASARRGRVVEVVIPHPGPIGIELGSDGVVSDVKAGSQGKAAGLKKDYKVVAVNGAPVEGWSLDRLQHFIASSARPLKLSLVAKSKGHVV